MASLPVPASAAGRVAGRVAVRPPPRAARAPRAPPASYRPRLHGRAPRRGLPFIEEGALARLPGRGASPQANRSPKPAALICLSPWQPGAQPSISCGEQLWEGVMTGSPREEGAGPSGGRRGGLHAQRARGRGVRRTRSAGDMEPGLRPPARACDGEAGESRGADGAVGDSVSPPPRGP